jgi:broad specificity phosphatase PhoE
MSTRVYLIRHGATKLAAEDQFAGETDVSLSAAGRDQVCRLAARLAQVPISAVYTSPLGRAMETARVLAAPHSVGVISRDGLREISHGHWETRTRAEVEQLYPEEYAHWEQDPYLFAPQGGETGLAVTARALPTLLDIVNAHRDHQVCVVSHKATIRLLLSVLLGFDLRTYRDHLEQSPAGLNILDFKDPVRARLLLFNDTSHYAEVGRVTASVPQGRLSEW